MASHISVCAGTACVKVDRAAALAASELLRNAVSVTDDDAPFPVPEAIVSAESLQLFAALCDLVHRREDPSRVLAGQSCDGLAQALRAVTFLDAPPVCSAIAGALASNIRKAASEGVVEVRRVLGAPDDLTPAEQEAARNEPLFAPPSAGDPPGAPVPAPDAPEVLGRSLSAALDNTDSLAMCLAALDARTLRLLKCVSRVWQRRARAALGDPNSAWRRAPVWAPSASVAECLALLDRPLPDDPLADERELLLLAIAGKGHCGVDPAHELPAVGARAVALLLDGSLRVREAARAVLKALDPDARALFVPPIVAQLREAEAEAGVVRLNLIWTLQLAEPAALAAHAGTLAAHAGTLLALLEDPASHVSFDLMRTARDGQFVSLSTQLLARDVIELLGPLLQSDPPQLLPAALGLADHPRPEVQASALKVLWHAPPAALATHAPALAAKARHPHPLVRHAAMRILYARLDAAVVARHADVLLAALDDDDPDFDIAAMAAEGIERHLPRDAVAAHAAELVARVGSGYVSRVLLWLGGDVIAGHMGQILSRLEHAEDPAPTAIAALLARHLGRDSYGWHAGPCPSPAPEHVEQLFALWERGVRPELVFDVLSKLLPDDVLEPAAVRLEHPEVRVREGALDLLKRCHAWQSRLARHSAAFVALLSDPSATVRERAAFVLTETLRPGACDDHIGALLAIADSAAVDAADADAVPDFSDFPDFPVEAAAMAAVAMAGRRRLNEHADAIVALLRHGNGHVRFVALSAAQRLSTSALRPHLAAYFDAVFRWVGADPCGPTQCESAHRFRPGVLAPHAAAFEAKLEDPNERVRKLAQALLARAREPDDGSGGDVDDGDSDSDGSRDSGDPFGKPPDFCGGDVDDGDSHSNGSRDSGDPFGKHPDF